jgi:hypothetical protein
MTWQPHLKIRLTNGTKTFNHCFMRSDVSDEEILLAFNKLKENFKSKENITISIGY